MLNSQTSNIPPLSTQVRIILEVTIDVEQNPISIAHTMIIENGSDIYSIHNTTTVYVKPMYEKYPQEHHWKGSNKRARVDMHTICLRGDLTTFFDVYPICELAYVDGASKKLTFVLQDTMINLLSRIVITMNPGKISLRSPQKSIITTPASARTYITSTLYCAACFMKKGRPLCVDSLE